MQTFEFGGTSGGRTHDKRIKSPLLYQLSYGPVSLNSILPLREAINYSVEILSITQPAAHCPKVAVTLTTEP